MGKINEKALKALIRAAVRIEHICASSRAPPACSEMSEIVATRAGRPHISGLNYRMICQPSPSRTDGAGTTLELVVIPKFNYSLSPRRELGIRRLTRPSSDSTG